MRNIKKLIYCPVIYFLIFSIFFLIGGVADCCAKESDAKEIDLVRTNGDVSGDSAEVINYNPSMVIGGQFFNPTPAQNPPIDSLISLPPIF